MNIKSWKSFSNSLIVLLLVLLVGAATALPSGFHLELCLDKDGHSDLSLSSCLEVPLADRQTEDECSAGHDHPDKCLDVVLFCGEAFKEYFSPGHKSNLTETKTLRNSPAASGGIASSLLPLHSPVCKKPSGRRAYRISSAPHLLSLRTVVLVI